VWPCTRAKEAEREAVPGHGQHRRDPGDQPLGVLGGSRRTRRSRREADDPERIWKEILEEVDGPISLETTELEAEAMYEQGVGLSQMAPNAVVKVPMTPDGLAAGKRLVAAGIRINVTLVFSPAQAILAAEIGADIVSPFLGRLDDVGSDGMDVLRRICDIYEIQGYETNVLAASLRHPMHIRVRSGRRGYRDHAIRRVQATREAPAHRHRIAQVPPGPERPPGGTG
jgi:transaldolase